jgi:two-component system response regulator HydG
VLVADDHIEMAKLLADQLADEGYEVDVAASGTEAIDMARRRHPEIVITDLRMEGVDGFDVVDAIRQIDPSVPVLIMTAFGAIDTAVEAMRRGAHHYFTKPFQLKEVLLYVERALAERRLRDENTALLRLAMDCCNLGTIVGRSDCMLDLYALIERVAQASAPVLVRGESGTGKELVARALHFLGPRRNRPFVAVNCTALPETLLESELFGHVRGAFTGATSPRRGLFLEADRGSLFLDEIGDMPANLQAKLLRVLEDGEVRSVGADATRKVDVRIIAASHQPLEDRGREGKFRADLLYRLNVVPIFVPPLRDRLEDIPHLVEHFIKKARGKNQGVKVVQFSSALIERLSGLPWPGNVRELENIVERIVIVCPHEVAEVEDLERHPPVRAGSASGAEWTSPSLRTLRELEDEYIGWVVRQCGGNKTQAAEVLGIDVSTIHRRERTAPR